ncbi:MAG: glutamine--tRNA ligase/YqeY domain fusion protein [Trueperaceae bacterium]|nr:glutamine--tRNA ligase/YqeY domain fusion protein [Trueperaceae bacterium]
MTVKAKASIPADENRMVSPNFITEIIDNDLTTGKHSEVVTRFPPEPNGYAHIGHTYASFIDYGIARDYGGRFHLRMDDTNPEGERMEYAEAIIEDLTWLGWDWGEHIYFASDYYDQLYAMAIRLIKAGKAYVDSLPEDAISEYRGTVTEPGKESPYRNRSVEENLELFERMRAGEFKEGEHILRAKIDMASPNMKLRDPILYRILHQSHYRTGDKWCIYPMYDYAHPLSDAIEGITHSLCSLEFVENRAIYDWLVDNLFEEPRPRQYEFGRRSLEYTIVSKRKLIQLVNGGHVSGWDDPRMPTLAGLRRRGVTPESIRDFASRVGTSRTNRTVDIALLEYAIRDDLNHKAPRIMGVLEPLKVVISNYEGEDWLEADYWPSDIAKSGSRKLPFSKTLYIEQEDFAERPPKGFKRLSPGEHVRLRHAYVIRCDEVIKDESGKISELRCSYFPDSLGENVSGIKVKGAIHWLSAEHALKAEIRLYDRLFSVPNPDDEEGTFLDYLNPESLIVKEGLVEPSVLSDAEGSRYQFERQGYFWQDPKDSSPEALVFNRIISLKDSWATKQVKPKADKEAKPAQPKVAASIGEPLDPVLSFSNEQKAKLEKLESKVFGLSHDDAVMLIADDKLVNYFEDAVLAYPNNPQLTANWIINELRRELAADEAPAQKLKAKDLAELIELINQETINNRIAKEVFAEMLEGKTARAIVAERGLEQVTDSSEIEPLIDKVLAANPDKVEAYKGGKTGLSGFFMGQVMRESGGKANPQLVKELIEKKLQ